MAAAFVLALLLSAWVPLAWSWRAALAALCLGGLLALHPGLVRGPVNVLLKWVGSKSLVEIRGSYGRALARTGLILLQRVGMLMAWLWLARSMLELPTEALPAVGLAFVLAGVAGFLVFFVPAGLGVQEGIMLLLLTPYMAPADAATLVIAARLFQLLVMLIGAAAGAALLPGARRTASGDHS